MDLSLEQRLVRFLDREEEGEARTSRDLRALAVEERVLEGECIQDAELVRVERDGGFVFAVGENLSKFREGDALAVGDGHDFAAAVPLVYAAYDAGEGELHLRVDPFQRVTVELEVGRRYVLDRRPLGLRGRLQEVVRQAFAGEMLVELLEGRARSERDGGRYRRARERLAGAGLNEAQLEAGAEAIASEGLALVQGPPGTGKTRLLAEVVVALGRAGCRLVLTAFTHRAVDNALRAIRERDGELPVVKVGRGRPSGLEAAGIRTVHPRRGPLPGAGVVAGTVFQLAKLGEGEGFHYAVFDEAGQMPIPHALAAMVRARRWLMFGDHAQLPPVITAEHSDRGVARSVFEHLHGHYGSRLLDVTYRMNDGVCAVVSEAFYGGALRPAEGVAGRRMPFRAGGHLDDVLDPGLPVVLARVDHLQPGMQSAEEARLVADLVGELVRRHRVPPGEIAVMAPFRAQVRQVRSALQRKGLTGIDELVVDTVERMQGQEREVVLLSLAVGDPDSLRERAGFFFSAHRLNVALSRARTKAVIVASEGAFRALPQDPESLRVASSFKSLRRRLPTVDLTPTYR